MLYFFDVIFLTDKKEERSKRVCPMNVSRTRQMQEDKNQAKFQESLKKILERYM